MSYICNSLCLLTPSSALSLVASVISVKIVQVRYAYNMTTRWLSWGLLDTISGLRYDIWPTTSVLPATVVLAHGQPPVWCWTFLVRRRHWETEHLPSPDRVSGTAFLLPSVIRHCRCQSSESCWSKPICLFKRRGAGDLWTGALEMYWLTN